MTDYTNFIYMLKRAGIEFTLEEGVEDTHTTVLLEVHSAGVIGYSGFRTEFAFHKHTGDLLRVEIWE